MKNQQNTAHGVIKKIVIPNLIWNLQRSSLQLTNSMRGRSRIKYGMTPYFKEEALNKNAFRAPLRSGFTLIELLVVVLIIGILAAVALPQYQLAVAKSRAATMLPILKAIAQADAVYYLENGTYSPNIHNLDVDMPGECSDTGDGVLGGGQVWKCGNYFLIDNSGGYLLNARYCPGKNDEYRGCKSVTDFVIAMHVEEGKVLKPECVVANNSPLGIKICNSLFN